jgi:hypothetical protein
MYIYSSTNLSTSQGYYSLVFLNILQPNFLVCVMLFLFPDSQISRKRESCVCVNFSFLFNLFTSCHFLRSGKQCSAKIELMFLVDGSGSIESYGRGNFQRCLNFVKQVASSFVISKTQGRVSVTVFSSKAKVIFGLNRYRTVQGVFRAVDKIR